MDEDYYALLGVTPDTSGEARQSARPTEGRRRCTTPIWDPARRLKP